MLRNLIAQIPKLLGKKDLASRKSISKSGFSVLFEQTVTSVGDSIIKENKFKFDTYSESMNGIIDDRDAGGDSKKETKGENEECESKNRQLSELREREELLRLRARIRAVALSGVVSGVGLEMEGSNV